MKKKREGRTLLQSDFCTHAHIHIFTTYNKVFLNLSVDGIQACRVVLYREWRDHPSTKGLLVQTLTSVIICPAVVSLSTVLNPSS